MLTKEQANELVKSGVIKKAPRGVKRKVEAAAVSTPAELRNLSASLMEIVERSSQPNEAMSKIIDSLLEVISGLKRIGDKPIMVNVPGRPSAWEFNLERDEQQRLSRVKATAVK